MQFLSVVIPIHDERDNLARLLPELDRALQALAAPHEVIGVDDGSTDGSLEELIRLRTEHPTLRIVSLDRRAGQSAALVAGFDAARGDVVVTLDADGQNDPADIPRLLALLGSAGAPSAVVGFRIRRADSAWRRMQSRIANRVRSWITGDRVRDTGCSLKAMRRSALMSLPRFDGMHRFLPALIRLQGGTVLEAPVAHRPRWHGVSKYGMLDRAARGLRDALGVRWLARRALKYEVRSEK